MLNDTVKLKHYYEVLEEAHQPEGVKIIVKNIVTDDFSDELIKTVEEALAKKPEMILQIRGLGGAMKRVSPDETAFGFRNAEVLIVCPTFIPLNFSDAQTVEALKPWLSIAKFGQGAYANFLSTAAEKDIKMVYPKTTYARLSEIKKIYDPENLLNQNYNIKPA